MVGLSFVSAGRWSVYQVVEPDNSYRMGCLYLQARVPSKASYSISRAFSACVLERRAVELSHKMGRRVFDKLGEVETEVEFAMFEFKAKLFVESNGGKVLLPDVQVECFQVPFSLSEGDDVLHQAACQALFAKIWVYNYALDIACGAGGPGWRQHEFGFPCGDACNLG